MDIEKCSSIEVREIALAGQHAHALMSVRFLPEVVHGGEPRPTVPVVAAVQALAQAAPTLQTALARAAEAGNALTVTFRPEVISGLRDGSLHLMQSTLRHRLPGAADALERAHTSVKALVEHLNANVLPVILDPYNPADVVIELDRVTVRELVAARPGTEAT